MFPLSSYHEFSAVAELAIALALGVGFGFALERAGFGSARKLTAVFYLYDMAVVKVMFSAVVTTLVGLALLSGAGLFDMSEIYLEQTNWTAQIGGGLLFGAGFVIGGYCPGTSMAAVATGRKDGMLFVLGMLAGVWAYAEFTPGLDEWYKATASGVITLPEATGIAMGWWALAFVAVLAFGAWGMARLERRFSYLDPQA
ncbi:MAG: sulfurtransferase [Leptothrix sp. (in: Bacteria)]|nr:sulfurtransferase [Leptothrix sp. (in: b-proteobacteria)]